MTSGSMLFHGSGATSGSEDFDVLRARLAAELPLRQEVEWALRLVVEHFNPTNRSNRFVVGGLVEWVIASAAFQAGLLALPEGHDMDGYDLVNLREQAKGLWSIKSSFSMKVGGFIITNGRGGAGRGMQDPTVFLSPRLPGLVLVHPDVHFDVLAEQEDEGDSTTLKLAVIAAHATQHPECVAPLEVPVNPGVEAMDPALDAAKLLLQGPQFVRLRAMFEAAEVRRDTSITAELGRLRLMRDQELLTEEQFQAAVNRTVGVVHAS